MRNTLLDQIVQVELQLIQIKKRVRAIEEMVASLNPNLAENIRDINNDIYKSEMSLSSISQSPSDSDIPMLYDDYLDLQSKCKALGTGGKSLTAANKTFVHATGAR
jgi:hypothetical protein